VLEASATEKAELEATVRALNTKLDDSNRALAAAKTELGSLNKQLEDSKVAFVKTKAKLEEELLAVNKELTESKTALANAQSESTNEVDALKGENEYLRSNIQELNKQLVNAATASEADKAALQKQLDNAKAELLSNDSLIEQLQKAKADSILECTNKLTSLNHELGSFKARDASIIGAYEKLADSNHPTDADQLQAYIETLNQAVRVLTDDAERTKAQALLSKASAYMKEKIDAFKNFKERVARLHAPINGDSTIYNIDEMAEIIDKFVSATTQKSSTEHPFQMVMDHFSPKKVEGGDPSDTDDITVT
jgi:chromosome segregation ATPase